MFGGGGATTAKRMKIDPHCQISETTVCGAYCPPYDIFVQSEFVPLNSLSTTAELGRMALLFGKNEILGNK